MLLRHGATERVLLSGTGAGERGATSTLLALARFGGQPAVVLGQMRGADRLIDPAALREARRGMALAAGLGLPLVLVIDPAGAALSAIAKEEDLNGRIRRNVMDTRRALSFMMRSRMLNAEQFEEARQILRDIDSLDSHTAFLFDKINFLMDATVGFININQNKIIKIFSVASVALLPPTLIASIYGMNFQYMPELNQTWGYPAALVLMVLSAVGPMLYFRKRGWLK